MFLVLNLSFGHKVFGVSLELTLKTDGNPKIKLKNLQSKNACAVLTKISIKFKSQNSSQSTFIIPLNQTFLSNF